MGGVFLLGDELRLCPQLVVQHHREGRGDGYHRAAARTGDLDCGIWLLRHIVFPSFCVCERSRETLTSHGGLSPQLNLLPVRTAEDDTPPTVLSGLSCGGIVGCAD